ncbi:MAG: hypothetical protein II566_10860 [Lachnospiraceae bacterium]|nr:hypothetical protein [Lachnospiraceae bacterium]MBQ2577760.1 hypothetical protein [Lachnospiraceae bacterium]
MKKTGKKLIVGITLTACLLMGYGSPALEAFPLAAAITNEQTVEAKTTYNSIYKSYAKKIKKATPKLLAKFKKKIKKLNSVSDKAELTQKYIQKLATIQVDGTKAMATLMYKNGDDYSTYEKWAMKLMKVYEKQAGKITSVYMNSLT